MPQTPPLAVHHDLVQCEDQIRDQLQIMTIVFSLLNAELLPDQIRMKSFLRVGEDALRRLTAMVDGGAGRPPRSAANTAAKIVVMEAGQISRPAALAGELQREENAIGA